MPDRKLPIRNRDRSLPVGADEMLRGDRRKAWLLTAGILVLAIGFGLSCPLLFDPPKDGTNRWLLGALIAGIILGVGSMLPIAQWIQVGRVTRRLKAFNRGEHLAHWTYTPEEWQGFLPDWDHNSPVGEAYVGNQYGYCNGELVEWNVFGQTVTSAAVVDGTPAIFCMVVELHNPDGNSTRVFRAPVPAGRVEEANRVIQQISQFKQKAKWARWSTFAVSMGLFVLSVIVLIVGLLISFAK